MAQILLELAADSLEDEAGADAAGGAEVRQAVCQAVHACFLAHPDVVRVVHRQRYDPRLLPLLVREVPSMHHIVRSLLLPELLAAPNPVTPTPPPPPPGRER